MSDAGDRGGGRGQPNGDDHLGDDLLSRLVDGDLSPEEHRVTQAHLASCAECRESLDVIRAMVTLLRSLPSPRPARSFQLASSHARQPAGWRRFSSRLMAEMPALRAAVVAVVLIIGGAAAFGVLRDNDEFSSGPATNMQSASTVAPSGGEGAPAIIVTIENPPREQAQIKTSVPTDTADSSASRSGQDAAAAESATSVPDPADEVAEEIAPVSAAPNPASAATSVAVASTTPKQASIVRIDEETAADEPADDAARTESTTDGGSADAEEDDTDLEMAGDAPEGAPNEESAPETSAAFTLATSTSTNSPSPTATLQPTNTPSTPVGSPRATPNASPMASPFGTATGQSIPIDGNMADRRTPRQIDMMLALAICVMIGGMVVAFRAARGIVR